MEHRDRATGWKHAKLSGHNNESLVKMRLDSDPIFASSLLNRINRPHSNIINTTIGGLYETNVPSVNGKTTKNKTDLKLYLDTEEIVNISIKKSLSGQVYLVSPHNFINTFERQFNTYINSDVRRAINLFWSDADDANDIIEKYSDKTNKKNYDLQLRHHSLNANTLKCYDETLYHTLLDWFIENSSKLAKLSFSTGAVQPNDEWSDFVWYINLLGETTVDDIFLIDDICRKAQHAAYIETYYSNLNGGTTIQLPFGFVQWHQSKMQFHHKYDKLKNLLSVF